MEISSFVSLIIPPRTSRQHRSESSGRSLIPYLLSPWPPLARRLSGQTRVSSRTAYTTQDKQPRA